MEKRSPQVDEKVEDAAARDGLISALRGETELKDLLDVDEHFIQSVEQKAYSLYAAGRYLTAETLLDGLVSLDPKRAYPHVLLGDIALRTEQAEKARHCLDVAFELDPEDACTALKLAESLFQLGETEDAVELLERVPSMGDEDDPHVQRAEFLLKQHRS